MSDTVTVKVELPVDALRRWRDVCERHRHTYKKWADLDGDVAGRLYLALLDAELPEPPKVGDKVFPLGLDGPQGTIIAIHGEHAWVEGLSVPATFRLDDLVRVEDRPMSDDLVKRLRAMGYPPPLDDQDAVMSYVLDAEEDATAAADRIEELTAERDALLRVADWVRRYQAEWETPAPDLTLRASIRQAMFDALEPEDGER